MKEFFTEFLQNGGQHDLILCFYSKTFTNSQYIGGYFKPFIEGRKEESKGTQQ